MDFYAMIYPFPPDAIRDIAYYFTDANIDAKYRLDLAPYLGRLQAAVQGWQDAWRDADAIPRLHLSRTGKETWLTDSRRGRTLHRPLAPIEVAVLVAADTPVEPARLRGRLAEEWGASSVERAMAQLDDAGLFFREGPARDELGPQTQAARVHVSARHGPGRCAASRRARGAAGPDTGAASSEVQTKSVAAGTGEYVVSDLLERLWSLPAQMSSELVHKNPLSLAQERLWFINQLAAGRGLYAASSGLRLRGRLDMPALWNAIDEIVRRHAILRTRFPEIDGTPFQLVEPARPLPRIVFDLSGLDGKARDERLSSLIRKEARSFGNLATSPPFRAILARAGPEDHCLILAIHHIASDRWSAGLLAAELSELYAARIAGRTADLPALPIQFADFARWERQQRTSERSVRGLEYWERMLHDAPSVVSLQSDRPRRASANHRGRRFRKWLPAEFAAETRRCAAEKKTTPFVVLLAAFHAALARHADTNDIVIGTPVNRRDRNELTRLIGIFADTLALRITAPANATFSSLVDIVRSATLGALEHQDVPFELIAERLRPNRDLSHHPIFQVMFSVDNSDLQAPTLPGLDVEQIGSDPGTSRFDLAMSIDFGAYGLGILLEYDADLFDQSRIELFVDHFRTILRSVHQDPDRRLDQLSLAKVSAEPSTRRLTVVEPCLTRFAKAVAAQPDAIAVEAHGTAVTYRALEKRVDQCARHLTARGIAAGHRVAVLTERGPDLPALLLALHGLGATFVPIDP